VPIQNLKTIREKLNFSTNTNIVDIKNDFETILEKVMLSFESGDVGIDVFRKEIKRETCVDSGRKEPTDKYFQRVHSVVGQEISRLTGTNDDIKVKYELFRLPSKEHFLVFFLAPSVDVDEDSIEETLDYLDEISNKLEENQKRQLLQSLLSLVVKASVYESCLGTSSICAEFYNSDLLLSPIVKADKKNKKAYVNCLRPSFFYSESGELIFDISTSSFELEQEQSCTNSTEVVSGAVNTYMMHEGRKHKFVRQVRATSSKRDFYAVDANFGDSKLLAYSYVRAAIHKKLSEIGIEFSARKFTPTYEVDAFARIDSDLTPKLNPIYLVDTKNEESKGIEGYNLYLEKISELIGAEKVIELEEYRNRYSDCSASTTFVFMNGSKVDDGTIEYFNESLLAELKLKDKESHFPSFNTTFQAFDAAIKDRKANIESSFDPYTEVKLELLENALSGKFSHHCFQGFNVTSCAVKTFLKSEELTARSNGVGGLLSNAETMQVKKAQNSLKAKVGKIKTELLLKQSVFCAKPIYLKDNSGKQISDGNFYIDFFKHTKGQDNNEYYHSKICIAVKEGNILVTDKQVKRQIRERINIDSPYLADINKIYNESYFIHCKDTGETITSYNSIRTPLSLESVLRDLPSEWEQYGSEPLAGKMFRRSTGAKKGDKVSAVLPFYINAARGKKDELSDDAKQHHYLILEPNGHECLLMVTDASTPNATICKQNLMKNIICWDSNNQPIQWDKSSLFDFYLSCHTYNIIKLNESAKTTLLTKLASITLLN
jgi:hypothetical protein